MSNREPSGQWCPHAVYFVSPRLVYLKTRVRYDSSLWKLALYSNKNRHQAPDLNHDHKQNLNDWRKRIQKKQFMVHINYRLQFSHCVKRNTRLNRCVQKTGHTFLGNRTWIRTVMPSKQEPTRANVLNCHWEDWESRCHEFIKYSG